MAGLKINRKQLTPITEEGLPDTGGNIAALETEAPQPYATDFDVCTWPWGDRAKILTLPLYDLLYL